MFGIEFIGQGMIHCQQAGSQRNDKPHRSSFVDIGCYAEVPPDEAHMAHLKLQMHRLASSSWREAAHGVRGSMGPRQIGEHRSGRFNLYGPTARLLHYQSESQLKCHRAEWRFSTFSNSGEYRWPTLQRGRAAWDGRRCQLHAAHPERSEGSDWNPQCPVWQGGHSQLTP